jgi:branched-chain amino acid aminotransferase
MSANIYLYFNNQLLKTGVPVLMAHNRSFRYGEGVFETLKVVKGRVLFIDWHVERLQKALALVLLPVPAWLTPGGVQEKLISLLQKNQQSTARIRLTCWRGNGGLFEFEPDALQYCMESFPLETAGYAFNENGLELGVFDAARKNCDAVSNYKTASHLPYALAAVYAKKNQLNDCFVLNQHGRVCDTAIANVFSVKNQKITTPPLSEGCIDGVLRRWLLQQLPQAGFEVEEAPIAVDMLQQADEIFVTNVIKGIRWVKTVGAHTYTHLLSPKVHRLLATAFPG